MKAFKVKIQPTNTPRILEVIWKLPPFNWIKINCDGVSLVNLGPFVCGGIVRNFEGHFFEAFANFLGDSNSLIVELSCAMSPIEFTNEKD